MKERLQKVLLLFEIFLFCLIANLLLFGGEITMFFAPALAVLAGGIVAIIDLKKELKEIAEQKKRIEELKVQIHAKR